MDGALNYVFFFFQTAAGKEDQFQLYACFYEASMIERKVGDKMIQFEMSIGIGICFLVIDSHFSFRGIHQPVEL